MNDTAFADWGSSRRDARRRLADLVSCVSRAGSAGSREAARLHATRPT